MRTVYSEQMLEFLRQNVDGMSMRELAERFNEKFGTDVGRKAIIACVNRRGWGNGRSHQSNVFPEEARQFMADYCQGNRPREMQRLLREAFGREWSVEQIRAYYRKHGLKCGVAGRYMPVGALVFRPGEWYYEKVAEGPDSNANWRSKHVLVWEAAHGPVPEGHMVIFLNGDRRDYALENLALCSWEVGMEVNRRGLRFADPEATRAGLLIAQISQKVRKMEKGAEGGTDDKNAR